MFACVIVCLQARVGPRGPPGPPGATNCTQLTALPAAGGCGLIPIDVLELFTTEFILEFIKQQNQLSAVLQSYNDLAMAVSVIEDKTAFLPAGPTNTTQTNKTQPLCGPPRKLSRNNFIIGFNVQDPLSTTGTPCNATVLAAFKQAMIQQVNSKDLCVNQTVDVKVACDPVGSFAQYGAEITIFSYYPCR